mmetsp:Transcript_11687/g.39916  ORF Transcript_11687/g.39916 Transcript_11687/m.39916 type:complete len:390 (-) Transcript_11687:634-1803(-)
MAGTWPFTPSPWRPCPGPRGGSPSATLRRGASRRAWARCCSTRATGRASAAPSPRRPTAGPTPPAAGARASRGRPSWLTTRTAPSPRPLWTTAMPACAARPSASRPRAPRRPGAPAKGPSGRTNHARSRGVALRGPRSERVLPVVRRAVKVVVLVDELHLVPQDAPDTPKPLYKLRALLGAVRDELERGAEALVVLREPLDELLLLDHLELRARLRVVEEGLVLGLLVREVQHGLLPRGVVLEHVAVHLEVLVDEQRLHSTHLERAERVLHAKAVAARVLGNLLEVLGDELLLLYELDVREHLRGELDGLVEAVIAAVRHVHHFEHLGREARVPVVVLLEVVLEVRRAREHEARDVALVVGDEHLRGDLRHLADVVLALLQAQARKPER